MIRVLFQGDSITDANRNRLFRRSLAGYPKMTVAILEKKYGKKKYSFFNRGISGDRSIDLLKRYRRHFVKMHPDVVTIMIGINDVWRKYDRHSITTPETYRENLVKLFTDIKSDLGAKIIVLSPYLTPNAKHDEMRADVDVFIAVCKEVAEEYADAYIDTDTPMNEAAKVFSPKAVSEDGVHPAQKGQEVLAGLLAEKIEELY